ncbi:MAG: hypothetical protein BGO69_13845 [Bacteroidetes bacterium 46-16]|nr:MAG: hypothetical protein BGO69_13845 [Bacteroidetes bacterium 46-16]
MGKFLAYFDLLGYKNFIEQNTPGFLDSRTNHFGRNVEMALSLGKRRESKHPGRYLADIRESTLNSLTFSDTLVIWSQKDTLADFEEILKVSFEYNHFNVDYDFPSRGCIVYGDIWFKDYDEENQKGGRYMLNMIYGKALIDAHLKAEAMSWAGCVLDISAIEKGRSLGNIDILLHDYTMPFDVPYKVKEKGIEKEIKMPEIALRLEKGDLLITEYIEEGIKNAFTSDNKGLIEGRVKVIFDNTIEFLNAHKIKFPYCYYNDASTKDLAYEVFGKLEENYTHTIITKQQDLTEENNPIAYSKEIVQFDVQTSNRDFLNAKRISEDEYRTVFEAAN